MRLGALLVAILCIIGLGVGEGYDPKLEKARAYFKNGFTLFNKCKYLEAIAQYKEALDLAPEFGLAWYWAGKAYYKAGLNEQAVLCWKRFLELKGSNDEIERKIKTLFSREYRTRKEPLVYRHLSTFPQKRFRRGDFYTPTSLAIDNKTGNIYVVNSGGSKILKLSPTGELLFEFGNKELKGPFGIALAEKGEIYVTDFADDRVKKFDSKGKLLKSFGGPGKGRGKFYGPQGIAIDRLGNIYVADSGNARIQKFDKEGRFLMMFGGRGSLAGSFSHPTDLLVEEGGEIWVVDSANQHIQRFDPSGNLLTEARLPDLRSEPRGIVADEENNLYISDANGKVYRYKPFAGEWQLLKLAETEPMIPIDISMNRHGHLYVADFRNHSIKVFGSQEHLQTGFDLFIDRVITDHYPVITYCVTVTGKDGLPVGGLTEKNFKISEGGRIMFPIGVKNPIEERDNLVAVFVVDTSKEMAKYKDKIEKAIFRFIKHMREGKDAGVVIGFSDRLYHKQGPTMNKDRLTYGVGTLIYGRGLVQDLLPKAIYRGVSDTLNVSGRKVLLLFTYGLRGDVKTTLMNQAMNYTKNNSVQPIIIDFREGKEVDKGLLRFSRFTNGIYMLAHHSPGRLENLFDEAKGLVKVQSQYILFYETFGKRFSGRWVDGMVACGHGRLYAEDLGGYIVP